ncbi:MAG TPA: aspartate/glutamate racemase family protein [Candidatus Avidesulfovibrio excrementigallinarum]|nr:aspartate/glutamate racemase family protein [Candidatus Avidesulfovibrio excrementigallinarum]
MFIPNGQLYYDTPVGVLCLDTQFAKPVGQLRNPLTFPFPVVCRVLPGIGAAEIFAGSAELGRVMVETARQLEKEGVQAIAGSCGFMALYQKQVAAAVRVPVLMSSLMQLPLIRTLHGEASRLGVLTAQSKALTREHFRQAGVTDALYDSLLIRGMEDSPYFRSVILECATPGMDTDRLGEEIVEMATRMVREGNLDALLFECTDLCAFAHDVQRATGVPVYDINALVEYAAFCVRRKAYINK